MTRKEARTAKKVLSKRVDMLQLNDKRYKK